MNFYAHRKVSELERDLRDAKAKHPQLEREHRPDLFGPLALRAGGALRFFGERLESWAAPPSPETRNPVRHDAP